LDREQKFHDAWAQTALADLPDPVQVNEALTSPELRYIHRSLGNISGKRVMDLGCGLGEASVYFALRGAEVTAVDLSGEMLGATMALASRYKVTLKTHKAASETLGLGASEMFDIIYVGNLFHHVEISETLNGLLKHLKSDGSLVSWDPLAYNPVINVYRSIATEVRTEDEHPLKVGDVRHITSRFAKTEVKYFWLTTLVIFILMAVAQRRNPNKVRFWKAVVDESESWRWLFVPLEALDRALLAVFPPLKWLCWNVVIICQGPKNHV
jgi:2-polyprenyl-3-methyl-5-hydroxy-6-metoxy-1,4-benzoquinol methylase